MRTNPLVGKTITALHVADDKQALKFDFEDGDSLVVRVDADCCSHTWVERVENVEQILNSQVVSVEDIALEREEKDDYDVVQFYGCKISTAKGYALIDYRNSSNGYYGGNLVWTPDEYFSGGVYDQNVSTQVWVEVQGE